MPIASRSRLLLRVLLGLLIALIRSLWVPREHRMRCNAKTLRRAMERLGLTYLKLGQFLAIRHDLLPPEFIKELTHLFEDVQPLSFAEVKTTIETAFGEELHTLFLNFEEVPIAAASIAQVHRARLPGEQVVAVKVQRPGIAAIFEADIAILRLLAKSADQIGLLGNLSVLEIVEQFAVYTRREFDFRIEASTAERLRRQAPPGCRILRIFRLLTCENVLTMDFIEGLSLASICTLTESKNEALLAAWLPNFNRRQMLRTLTRTSLHQFFVTGIFHGDPHPGNILVREDNSIAPLDFGIFGTLSAPSQALLARYAECLATGQIAESFRHLSRIYIASTKSDPRAFRNEAIAALRAWTEASRDPVAPMAARHLGGSFTAMIGVVRRHHYWTAMDYLLFWRAMIVLDSIALRIDPEFDITAEMRSFFSHLRPSPTAQLISFLGDARWIIRSTDALCGTLQQSAWAGSDAMAALLYEPI
jgi:ubiquinone biosynthesis protein